MASNVQSLEGLFNRIASNLDIPDHIAEEAILKYEDIGLWLCAEDSDLAACSPEIYPQGSFRLGTVIRPIGGNDEYDIDLVCQLQIPKEETTQKNLKSIVGDRLRKRDDLAQILEARRRCWRLAYEPETTSFRFHLDVLPTIPNIERPPSGLLLTDTDLLRWQKSNPQAYADWFQRRMAFRFQKARTMLAETANVSVEEVPEWRVRTPLQLAVQILKRHRDFHFQTRPDEKPVSIIITTLAAHAYESEESVVEALAKITRKLPTQVEKRGDKWWVANPVDPDENFADKWNQYPERQVAFAQWASKAQSDLSSAAETSSLVRASLTLNTTLGSSIVTKAANDIGVELPDTVGDLVTTSKRPIVPGLAGTTHLQAPPWPLQLRYKANVRGSVHHIKSGKKLWSMEGRAIPKNVRLSFEVKTNTPPPYKVMWQVVNTGKEAALANALRGSLRD